MKKYIFWGVILFVFPIFGVNATSISSIDMDIYVKDNGDAIVTETWVANVTEGTEGYHPYYNLGNSSIGDLSVTMDGTFFTTVDDWDISNNFKEKSYKAGIYNASSNEVDICFGISSYGRHTYVIKYTITGFVVGLNDADMIYWNLFPYDFSAEPDKVSVSIFSDFSYSDSLDVWGYGDYGAPCYVYDGKIEMESNGQLDSNEYLTILVKFSKGTFNTGNVINKDFDYYYDMASEESVNYSDKSQSFSSNIFDILVVFLVLFINIFVWLPIVFVIIKSSCSGKKIKCRFGNTGNKVPKVVPNFRDIPCNKDVYRAYWVAINYGLVKKKEDFLGTILLKWLRDGNIKVEKVEKKGLLKKKFENNVVFVNSPTDCIELESKLYKWMYEASGDGKLESDEFKLWCKKNYSKIFEWFDDVIDFESKMLVNEGKASITEEIKLKVLKFRYYDIDSSMMLDALEMAGLKKYLKEFTLIKEKEPIEVKLWDEYLMYAQIFGIAEKVAKQFKKLYPEVTNEINSMGYDYSDILFIYMISYNGISSASSARDRANSYSSGGGGFSSGGGGAGSFGGGGGGGGFR